MFTAPEWSTCPSPRSTGRRFRGSATGACSSPSPPGLFVGWLRRFVLKYCLVDFGAIAALVFFGAALALFGLIFGSVRWAQAVQNGVAATTGTVMLAALPLILGMQLLLQALLLEISNSPGSDTSNILRHEWASGQSPDGRRGAAEER